MFLFFIVSQMRKTIAIATTALLLIGCAEMNTVLNDMNTIPTGPAPLTNVEATDEQAH